MNVSAHGLRSRFAPPPDDGPPPPGSQRVLVRISGIVDASNGAVLTETVAASLGIALHVVVDLSGAARVTPAGWGALLELSRTATRRGTCLHITGVTRIHRHDAGHLPERAGLPRPSGR